MDLKQTLKKCKKLSLGNIWAGKSCNKQLNLQKQKGGMPGATPADRLSKAMYVLNYLNMPENNIPVIFSHFLSLQSKDLIATPTKGLIGVGGLSQTFQSTHLLNINTQEGSTFTVWPYVTNLPMSLLGRDVMSQCGFILNCPENFQ